MTTTAATLTPEIVAAFTAFRSAEARMDSLRNWHHGLNEDETRAARPAFRAAIDAYAPILDSRRAAFEAATAGLSDDEESEILRALDAR